jgi:hypothetical protein
MMDGRIIGTYLLKELLRCSDKRSWEEEPKFLIGTTGALDTGITMNVAERMVP